MRNEMVEKISAHIRENFGYTAKIYEKTTLIDDIGLDSLSLTALIIEMENIFNIVFDDGDLDPSVLRTVGSIADLVSKYIK